MKVAIFSAHDYEKSFFEEANRSFGFHLSYFEEKLNSQTAILAKDFPVVSGFVTDSFDKTTLEQLVQNGTRFVALRSTGFNHVDCVTAKELQLPITRVPVYSPYAIAEFAVGLILALNRKIPRAYNHVLEHNFSLSGQLGFDLHGKTVGIIGTGNIGSVFAKIMQGFGCQLLGVDPVPKDICLEYGLKYVSLPELYQASDIISLHCPLTSETHRLIDQTALKQMKEGVMLINTGRGKLLDTQAIISGLKSKRIGYLGLDVYEKEEPIFFTDHSLDIIQDDTFVRLNSFPNVIITGHQAFFTKEAMTNITRITLENIREYQQNTVLRNLIPYE